ncbi:MAG: hypothetical protein H0T79_22250, partial [Deltaproteobacteria bacterium]|nr:hypothetical protein [Deltaproteobacteria bacterium]
LTLPNPGALGAWVAVAAIWPAGSPLLATLVGLGVGAGSALWFVLLGRWVGTVRRDHPVVRAIPRVAVVALIAIAIVGVARVV